MRVGQAIFHRGLVVITFGDDQMPLEIRAVGDLGALESASQEPVEFDGTNIGSKRKNDVLVRSYADGAGGVIVRWHKRVCRTRTLDRSGKSAPGASASLCSDNRCYRLLVQSQQVLSTLQVRIEP